MTVVEDGKVLMEPSEVVEVFNNYFESVAVPETHSGSVENFSDHPSVLGIASRDVLEHPTSIVFPSPPPHFDCFSFSSSF